MQVGSGFGLLHWFKMGTQGSGGSGSGGSVPGRLGGAGGEVVHATCGGVAAGRSELSNPQTSMPCAY